MLWLLLSWISGGNGAIDGYQAYDAFRAEIQKLGGLDVVNVAPLGRTRGNREVFLLTIGVGKVHEKPAFLILGNVHAPHLAGSELAVRLARLLAEKGQGLLESHTFYVIPRPTPDGSEAFFRTPCFEKPGNDRKTDDDRDAEIGEDPPDDLNGDGIITMMRVEDATGAFMPHPDDPRILIEADPKKNEKGRYLLFTEGKDDDGDERFNEDGAGGVSFNRNFPFRYPHFQTGAGPHQVSEIETRAVADFAFAHPNIVAVFAFSPEDNLATPWKPQDNQAAVKNALLPADAPYFDYIAERYREIHGGKDAPAPPAGEGSFSEWAYFQFGRWSFAARAWWIPREGEAPKESRGADLVYALRWFEKEKIDGFVPWTLIPHPDFPGRKVEVGGIKPFLLLNPPAKELDPLAEKHFSFLSRLAELFPRVKLHEIKTDDLGDGSVRIRITVTNVGYLPTISEMGKTTREFYPLQVRIDLPKGSSLVTGSVRTPLAPLAGNGGKTEHTWIVSGAHGSATITAWALSLGSDSKTLLLK